MVISVLVIAALVEISAVFWGVQFLERELRRHSAKADERHAELVGKAAALASILNELRRDLAGMEDRRRKGTEELRKEIFNRFDGCLSYGAESVKTLGGLWNESEKQTAALQSLLAREDSAEALKQLRALLEDSPAVLSREQEAAMSKAMEDGIASIMAYTSGKVPGVELHL